jgi:hypothetical protein
LASRGSVPIIYSSRYPNDSIFVRRTATRRADD